MTWFKVGDELTYHPRVQRAGNAAIGLWVRAGTFCSEHLTDGWISHEDARTIGSASEIRKLVAVGQWFEEARDGQKGYQFHRWAANHLGQPRQPSRAEVEKKRREAAERQAKHRAKRASEGEDSQPAVTSEESVSHADVKRDSHVSHATPDPTRPGLPPSEEKSGAADAPPDPEPKARKGRARRLPDGFHVTPAMAAWAAEKVPNLDVPPATEEFVSYWLGRGTPMVDWEQTWRNGMLKVDRRGDFRKPQGGRQRYDGMREL